MLTGDPERSASRHGAGEEPELQRQAPPVVIMMVGLQGSGKTTTTAKLGKLIREKPRQEGNDGIARRQPSGGARAA